MVSVTNSNTMRGKIPDLFFMNSVQWYPLEVGTDWGLVSRPNDDVVQNFYSSYLVPASPVLKVHFVYSVVGTSHRVFSGVRLANDGLSGLAVDDIPRDLRFHFFVPVVGVCCCHVLYYKVSVTNSNTMRGK